MSREKPTPAELREAARQVRAALAVLQPVSDAERAAVADARRQARAMVDRARRIERRNNE